MPNKAPGPTFNSQLTIHNSQFTIPNWSSTAELAEILDRSRQPFFQFDLWFPPEERSRAADVRLTDFRVVFRERLENDLAAGAGQLPDRVREFEHGQLARVADVDGVWLAGEEQAGGPPDQG